MIKNPNPKPLNPRPEDCSSQLSLETFQNSWLQVIEEETLDEIIPGLFLGGIPAAWKVDELRERNVSQVLDFSRRPYHRHEGFDYWVITDCRDTVKENISRYFEKTSAWIEEALKEEKGVLVHCHWGASRSATTVIAYLMRYRNMSLEEANQVVVAGRADAKPNRGFWRQLQTYAFKLGLGEEPEPLPASSDSD